MPSLDTAPPRDRAGAAPDNSPNHAKGVQPQAVSWSSFTWPQLLVLAFASVAMLNLAYAPVNQFYFAWVGLVPWLLAVWRIDRFWRAVAFGWISGLLFFGSTMTWLWHCTWLGTVLVQMYLATFWAVAAGVIYSLSRYPGGGLGWGFLRRGGRRNSPYGVDPDRTARSETNFRDASKEPSPQPSPGVPGEGVVILIPAAWVAVEWVRSWLFSGFPWLPLSQTQTPIPVVCQIADLTGHYGVTFWLVALNTLVALACVRRNAWRRMLFPVCTLAVFTIGILAYGGFRIAQKITAPGPTLLLVQPNFPHARGGARTVTQQQQIEHHFSTTERILQGRNDIDLVVWSETVMPPMNPEVRAAAGDAPFLGKVHADLLDLVHRHRASLVFGAYAVPKVQPKGAPASEADIRNATYLYAPGRPDQPRYDKIHLVPYGESVPFRHSIPSLHRLMFRIAAYSVDYVITPGGLDGLTVFQIAARGDQTYRFVTPICFEDVDAHLIAQMFRPRTAGSAAKSADFLVNITNDGWFNAQMKHQHLQNAIFRSIENRVWTARCSNTGISGFVDSAGRVVETLDSDTEGVAVRTMGIDPRVTIYTRWGDWFAWTCAAGTIAFVVRAWWFR